MISGFQKSLLDWYQKNKRDLPWRKTKDPYKIWLSEIMLQQTTVKTVVPYYENFLKKFPALENVVRATDEDLMHAWSGLGYYQRIRNFQKACNAVEVRYKGRIPSAYEKLIELPGLGPYTASAVASIAFGEKTAVVDGNVIRVLSRIFAYGDDISKTGSKLFFAEKARELLSEDHPGDFNQAMMELGATVCTPKNPVCLLCPVRVFCLASQKKEVEKYPVKLKKTVYKKENQVVLISSFKKDFLFRKRESDEILSGQWELPSFLVSEAEKESWFQKGKPLSPFSHAIMDRRIRVYPIVINKRSFFDLEKKEYVWIKEEELNKLPLTTISKKALKIFYENSSS